MTASSVSVGSPPPGDSPRRRDEILRAAAALIADEGYRAASMRDVAAAAGILAGSLYHHFPSKEAIAVELVEEYHADLVRTVRDFGPIAGDPLAALRSFARDVAEVSGRHRAAVQISKFDAPSTASSSLKTVVRALPASLDRHWRMLISAAALAGAIDPRLDTRILRHVLRSATLQAGIIVWERGAPDGGVRAAADCTTSILFEGLAVGAAALGDSTGKSAAIRAANEARARWAAEAAKRRTERRAALLEVARSQFALRGFEVTTMRDIAEAAGLPAGNFYRYFQSKDAMVAEILGEFSDCLLDAYQEVLATGGSAESLDGICWLLDHAGRHFSREIEMLKSHGKVLSLAAARHYREGAEARYGMLVSLIEAGVATGELNHLADPALVASCVREIMWAPMRNLAPISPVRVREFCRRSVLAGAAA